MPECSGREAGDEPQERGLARAVGAGEEHDIALGHVEIDAGEGGEAAEQADGGAELDDEGHGPSTGAAGNAAESVRRPL